MTFELATSVLIAIIIICLLCHKLSKEDEEFDEKFREEEEE